MSDLVHERALSITVATLLPLQDVPLSFEELAERINYSSKHAARIIRALEGDTLVTRYEGCRGRRYRYRVNVDRAVDLGYLPEPTHAAA